MRVGERLLLVPDRIGRRGEAEAEHEGRRVRVAGGIPGEAVRVEVTHVSRGGPVAEARVLAVEGAPDPARRAPPCPIHATCGGCGLQHVEVARALALKVAQARRLLPEAEEWRPALQSPRAFGYRAKTFLLPQRRGRRLLLGARPPRGDRLVDTSGCNVLRPELEALAGRVRAALSGHPDLADTLRSVLLRCSRAGRTQATLVHRGAPGALADAARGLGADAAFLQRHDAPGNVICSDAEERPVAGDGPVTERFGPLDVAIPPTAFWQGNPDVAEPLYDAAAGALEGEELGELYCGAGTAGLLAVARRPGARLHGVDRSPRAIAAAAANARRNGLADRCRFEAAPAEKVAVRWEAVLVNPPRAGCHAAVLDAVARSPARRLVYLSCNPATLARDARRLGWAVRWVLPADMLPQTPHLELLAVLER